MGKMDNEAAIAWGRGNSSGRSSEDNAAMGMAAAVMAESVCNI